MRMRILIVSQYYWPEPFGAGVWLHEMTRFLVAQGHRVTVLTAFPNHPDGIIHPAYRGRVFQREHHEGVNIVRTWIYAVPRTEMIRRRSLSYLSFALTCLPGSLAIGHPDVVLGLTPPLPMALSAWLIARSRRVPFLLNVQDVFPEAAVAAGLLRTGPTVHFLEAVERFLYRHADHITVISEVFRRNLLAKEVSPAKLTVIPNWADAGFITPQPKQNEFRQRLGLRDEFVILYSGNMGYVCDLDTILDAAALLRDDPAIQFVLVGDGARKGPAQERARELGLTNVRFLPLQPREEFPQVLAAADACLVTLAKDNAQASVPGKTYSIMAAGRPVLAVVEPVNDVHQLVVQESLGASVRPGDAHGLAEAIRTLKADQALAEACGRRARAIFEQRFTIEACVGQYERLMLEMLEKHGQGRKGKS
jgi:colanic acid biosynthesis glycosyl transferase WcaI